MSAVLARENYVLSGHISDSITHESLIGATIFLKPISAGTQTDAEGNFRITVNGGEYVLQVSYVGYSTREIFLKIESDTRISMGLGQSVTETGTVIVTARNPAENTESARTGLVEVTGKEIRKLPTLMGEADLIRALHYTPGVQSAGDGNSGFYVRGGNVDQNLIMLDNATVFNPSHVLGFFSVFNSDIISSATLIKSGIPANYGGRLSSVLAVKTIDGNFEKLAVSANIGLIYSKVSIQGPIVKNRLSYFISFRKTYINQVAKPFLDLFAKSDSGGVLFGNKYDMYDFNAKITWKPGTRNRLSLMFYKGKDNFSMERRNIGYSNLINWGNTLFSLNWSYQNSDSSYFSNSLNYSDYAYNFGSSQFILDMNLYSAIRNLNYRMEYNKSNFFHGTLKAGIDSRYYRFIPNKFLLSINKVDLNYGSYQDLYATELAAFISWEKDFTDRLRIYGGLRLSNYDHMGPYSRVIQSGNDGLRDTLIYRRGKLVQSYTYPEPRLSLRYQTSAGSSVKASYTRNYQFIHVASSSSVTLPSDIWIPSTREIKPQYGDQMTLGYYRNFKDNTYTGSVEVYYKRLHHQVEMLYGMGASFQETSFEKSIVSGKGYSTGIELYIQKQKGNLTGSLGYSLSRSVRQFDLINNGLWFPAKYDRRHEANFAAAYRLNDRWELSLAFLYASGNAMTIPEQKYFIEGNILNEYGKTNSYRMPAYHRMDLSVTCHFKPKHLLESNLNFSVFNVYNRANPFLVFFDIRGDIQHYNLEITARQISIFPILPSVSWNIQF